MIEPATSFAFVPLFLGWLRNLISWCWDALNGGNPGGILQWIGRHWLMLTLLLCIAGCMIDLAVYLFRWRPDLVLRSFIRRIKEGPIESGAEPEPMPDISEEEFTVQEADASDEPKPSRKIRAAMLTAKLLEATRNDGTDESTRLATYRPTMSKDRSQSFREPVYPVAPPDDRSGPHD